MPRLNPERKRFTSQLNSLQKALSNSFDNWYECMYDGILPAPFWAYFLMANFIAGALRSAQEAQRRYHVPASYLIAEAFILDSNLALYISRNRRDDPKLRRLRDADVVSKSFLQRAKLLSEEPWHTEETDPWCIHTSRYPSRYVKKLHREGLIEVDDRDSIIDCIEKFSLRACDRAAHYAEGFYDGIEKTSLDKFMRPSLDVGGPLTAYRAERERLYGYQREPMEIVLRGAK